MKSSTVAPVAWAGLALFALAGCAATVASDVGRGRESSMTEAAFTRTAYPRIAMLWSGLRGQNRHELTNWAKHDFVMVSPGQIGMVWDRQPEGLAEGFTPESVEVAKRNVAELRRLNPDVVILADNSFYEYGDNELPEDHPWWLRVNGERKQFWPGTHRMDWYNPEYQEHVLRRCEAIMQVPFDGLFFDNLRDEPGPWIAILGEIRNRLGNDILLQANVGYAIEEYDFAAPFLNGFMYESGWSHNRTEWDDCIKAMQHSASLMREPHINLIERFEEIRDHAGWPTDGRHGQRPASDPAARRWSLCFALAIGDYYYLFSDNTSHRHDWYPEYDVKIGLPTGPGRRVNTHVWERDYERARVVVNLPGSASEYVVKLDRPGRDSLTGETGREFAVPPGDGRVLLVEGE
ncbi:MAG: putative glycoside hydrolase [Armatimonadota bacterium]